MTGTSPDQLETNPAATGELFLLAITGSMGCGKSAVSRQLVKRGAYLLDADQDARAVLKPGSSGWQAVIEQFGTEILMENGASQQNSPPSDWTAAEIDRRILGEKVFHDPTARARLEAIIHPRIHQRQALALARWQKTTPYGSVAIVVAEVPLLFETGSDKRFDLTVAVLCGPQQWQRLQERTGMSSSIKQAIIDQQMPEEEKRRRAHWTIDNSGTWEETERQIEVFWHEINTITPKKRGRAWPDAWSEHLFL